MCCILIHVIKIIHSLSPHPLLLGTFTIPDWPIRPCPSTRTPVPGVMKFTILVDPSLVIITDAYRIVCLIHAQEKRRRFLEIHQFYTFTPKSSPLGVMVMKFIISYLLTLQTIQYQMWSRLAKLFLRRRC